MPAPPNQRIEDMFTPFRHNSCGKVFDLGFVTVKARYGDCDCFDCPGCGAFIDNREGVHGHKLTQHERARIEEGQIYDEYGGVRFKL